jgi:hypothetical protein
MQQQQRRPRSIITQAQVVASTVLVPAARNTSAAIARDVTDARTADVHVRAIATVAVLMTIADVIVTAIATVTVTVRHPSAQVAEVAVAVVAATMIVA